MKKKWREKGKTLALKFMEEKLANFLFLLIQGREVERLAQFKKKNDTKNSQKKNGAKY